jgi:tetrapyrrole methylase family protein/MazG family protein
MNHFQKLETVMAKLRSDDGCPWDREQTHQTLKICLMEETAEVLDAIDQCHDPLLIEELGDLLLQVVFHSQIAKEENRFSLKTVVEAITHKLISRHPHVFGDKVCNDAGEVINQWEAIKKAEKKDERKSVLDGIVPQMGTLHFTEKVVKKVRKAEIPVSVPELNPETVTRIEQGTASAEEAADLLFALTATLADQDIHAEEILRSKTNQFIRTARALEK